MRPITVTAAGGWHVFTRDELEPRRVVALRADPHLLARREREAPPSGGMQGGAYVEGGFTA
jgi:hypothetical protein